MSSVCQGTINSKLQELAEENPRKQAYIFWDKSLRKTVFTRQDIWDKSRKYAAFLRRQGIKRGDVVCNTLCNSKERLITTFGTILAGAVSMHGQKLLANGEDIIQNWRDSQCTAVIVQPGEERGVNDVLDSLRYTDNETSRIGYRGLPGLTQVIPITVGDTFADLLDEEPDTYVDEGVKSDNLAMIWATSGSTGFAKLIPHTHKRLLNIGNSLAKLMELKHDSLYFSRRSLGWVAGAPIIYPALGLTRVLVDVSYGSPDDPGALITHILEHEKCDTALIMPSGIQVVIDHLDSIGKHKFVAPLRSIGTGGGPISKKTMDAIGRITESIAVMYGASEFGVSHGLKVTDQSNYQNACCGYPVEPDITRTKIVDDNLQEVDPGKSGEILFQGPTLLPGYFNNQAADKDVFLDGGWFRTSDVGHKDEKGQLFVYCRQSFAINYRGYLHYPGWIETLLDKHLHIKKSLVVGIPDPTDIERICVCVTTVPESTLTASEVHEYYKSLFLTGESNDITPVPKYFLFFDSFPQNANGKIDRKKVKEIAVKRVEVECKDTLE